MRFALLGAALATLFAGAAAAQTVTMRISHQVPTAHHLHKMLEAFKADAEARTKGEVQVQIFPAEQLHKAAENHAAVARGSIESALVVNMQWGNTLPAMNVVVIPYFFPDLERIKRFPGSEAAKYLEKKIEEKGVKNLAWFYITRQAIYTSGKKPIASLDDFKGIKIRGFNKLADTALTSVGAATSAMPGPEVYNALKTGVLDAGLTDVSAAYSRRYYEVQKYGTVTPSLTVYFHMFVNPAWWNKLSPAHRTALEAAAKKAEADAIAITEKTAEEAVKQLREKGMELIVHTPAQAEVWKKAMQPPVIEAFIQSTGDEGKKLIELMNKL
ncbi:TRAP transporter substrate-binding protein DctP [Desertibaculum subflavum]|uniref:TRAP transporter substrate-binding protein DctP n=1 Tax=Desertibaculum subflavum TaxID=2268458 RepID=UPI0013C4FA4A